MKSNKLIHKKEQIFKMERDNVFAEKISLITNDDKKNAIKSFVRAYRYRESKDLLSQKEEIKCKNIIKQFKND